MVKKFAVALTVSLLLVSIVSSVYAASDVKVTVLGEDQAAQIESLTLRIHRLESALAPQSPQSAAELWAEAVKMRNGALQYALMSPELKREHYQDLVESNWSTGVSSPWVESFEITERKKADDKTFVFDIRYTLTDSTKATIIESETILVRAGQDGWFIAAIEQTPDIRGEVVEITDNDGRIRLYIEDNAGNGLYDKAYVAITDETEIFRGHSSEILSVDELKIGSKVEVSFRGPALLSYPVQVGAGMIRIL